MKRLVRNSPKREREGGIESNGHKRAKILKNDVALAEHAIEVAKNKSLEQPLQTESSNNHDKIPVLSENMESESSNRTHEITEPIEQTSVLTNGNGTIEDHNNLEISEQSQIQQNGTLEEIKSKETTSDSNITPQLYHEPESIVSDQPQLNEDSVQMPVLNPVNLDAIHNGGDSTNSFESSGFDSMLHSMKDTNNKDSELNSSHNNDEPCATVVPEIENGELQETAVPDHEENESIVTDKSLDKNETEKLTTDEAVKSFHEELSASSFNIENIDVAKFEVTRLEGHSEVIFSVAADEDFVLSSSGDTTVKLWSMTDQSLICNFSGHQDSVTSVLLLTQSQSDVLKSQLKLSNNVTRIAITGSLDCNIKLWSVFEGRELVSIYTFNGITSLGFLESESYVVVGTEGGKVELWDIFTSKAVQSFQAHDESVSDIKVVDCNIYTVSTDGTVIIWLYEDDDMYAVYTRKKKRDLDLNPSQFKSVAVWDNLIYLGDKSNCINVLDSRAGRLRHFWNQNQHDGMCECIVANNDILLTSFYDPSTDTGGVNVWKIPEMKYICSLTGDVQDVCSLALLRKENLLRIVTGGHQLLVWDFDFSKKHKSKLRADEIYHTVKMSKCGEEIVKHSRERVHTVTQEDTDETDSNGNKKWCNVM